MSAADYQKILDYQRMLDLKAMVPSLRKELNLLEKNLFNCYLEAPTTFIPIKRVKDIFAAFVVPASKYESLLSENDNDEEKLCALSDVIQIIKQNLVEAETIYQIPSINSWIDGLPAVVQNNIKKNSKKYLFKRPY